jgi:hypothetical protein
MGFVGDKPMAQHKRSFCAAFFKKRPLSSWLEIVARSGSIEP